MLTVEQKLLLIPEWIGLVAERECYDSFILSDWFYMYDECGIEVALQASKPAPTFEDYCQFYKPYL